MEKVFIRITNRIINVHAIHEVEINENGDVVIRVAESDKPVRIGGVKAREFLEVLERFTVPQRSAAGG